MGELLFTVTSLTLLRHQYIARERVNLGVPLEGKMLI